MPLLPKTTHEAYQFALNRPENSIPCLWIPKKPRIDNPFYRPEKRRIELPIEANLGDTAYLWKGVMRGDINCDNFLGQIAYVQGYPSISVEEMQTLFANYTFLTHMEPIITLKFASKTDPEILFESKMISDSEHPLYRFTLKNLVDALEKIPAPTEEKKQWYFHGRRALPKDDVLYIKIINY